MDGMKKIQAAMLAFVMVAVCTFALAAGGQDADADTIDPDTSWYDAGEDSFEIGTAEQLAGLAKLVNEGNTFKDKTVKLTKDVTLSGEWTPIGNGNRSSGTFTGSSFQGTFDGNACVISGLTITKAAELSSAIGLFGVVVGGTIEDVYLNDVSINVDCENVGAIAGVVCEGGCVTGCTTGEDGDGSTITAFQGTGGTVGRVLRWGSVIDSNNFAKISQQGSSRSEEGPQNAGGIVGAAYYTAAGKQMKIEGCTNFGEVSGTVGVGGIVGLSAAFLKNCVNVGNVSSVGYGIGGIVGEQTTYGSIVECTNFGNVDCKGASSSYGAGGIVGWIRYKNTSDSYPQSAIISVEGCINIGNIGSTGNNAGGIIGMVYNMGYVSDNVNLAGKIKAQTFAAGILTFQATEKVNGTVLNDLTLERNVSTTDYADISGGSKDKFVYDNPGTIKGSPSTDVLPADFTHPTKPVIVAPENVEEEISVEGDQASIVVTGTGVIETVTVNMASGSVKINNGSCSSGTITISIEVIEVPVVEAATKTFDVSISKIVSSDIIMTFYDISIPSGKVPKVFSYKDGEIVEEKVVSYTSSSVTIQTDHNTPFSIVLKSAPVSYDDDDDGGQYPWQPQQQSTSQQDDNKALIIAVAAAAAAVMAMAALMAFKKI